MLLLNGLKILIKFNYNLYAPGTRALNIDPLSLLILESAYFFTSLNSIVKLNGRFPKSTSLPSWYLNLKHNFEKFFEPSNIFTLLKNPFLESNKFPRG